MHLLLLAYHYPPSPEVGGLRAQNLARHARARGHAVTVITARLRGESDDRRADPDGIEVLVVTPWRTPRELYLALKARRAARHACSAVPPGEGDGGDIAPPTATPAWKRLIFSLLWLPDDRQGFVPAAIAAARDTLRPDTLVYTTAPPFSTHLAGERLAGAAPWVAEFRDPWMDNPWKPAHVRSGLGDALGRWLERRCLRRAIEVVSVSDGIARALDPKRQYLGRPAVRVIRNGLPELRPWRTPDASRPIHVVHVGTFYHRRDPRPFLDAVGRVLTAHPAARERLTITFAGKCRTYEGHSIQEEASRRGFADRLVLRDWIPHSESQRLVNGANLLLLLAQDQPIQVPNKLYEYLGAGVPILAYADNEGETAHMLRRAGGHFLVTEQGGGGAERALRVALGLETEPAPPPDQALLSTWTTHRQFAELLDRLEAIMRSGAA